MQYPKNSLISLAAIALEIVVRVEEAVVYIGHNGGIILLVLQINDITREVFQFFAKFQNSERIL